MATVAERHTTPRRALGGLLAVVLVTGTGIAILAARPAGQSAPRWLADESTIDPPPPPRPAPDREPPLARAAGPQQSPPPTAPDPGGDFVGWAVLDLATGTVTGSGNQSDTSTTASMIKVWIAADYLRRTAEAGDRPSQARLDQLTLVIRDSHNEYAEEIFREIGAHESIERLIESCGLTDSRPYPYRWSNTQLSPRDTARMGACIADGRAAGPEWTDWLLGEMRAVRGAGDFGIRQAFPAGERSAIAIKNGWVTREDAGEWHVNCLAIGDGWTMGVMTRYPIGLGYEHGARLCQSLAAEHLPSLAS